DLKNATAFVVPLGGGDAAELLDALNRASGFFRSWIAKRVRLRHMPKIGFLADRSFDEAAKIEAALKDPRVAADLARKPNDEA
ncbi:MAG: ribosome-binding factor A, partial [Proteobacteria bacterium]|nr:ribosome-binding factor A [Pseudomonadota bacterium]